MLIAASPAGLIWEMWDEYSCQTCHTRFERLRPMSRMDDEAPCPDCAGGSRRELSVFAALSRSANGEVSSLAGAGCGGCGPGGCACSMGP